MSLAYSSSCTFIPNHCFFISKWNPASSVLDRNGDEKMRLVRLHLLRVWNERESNLKGFYLFIYYTNEQNSLRKNKLKGFEAGLDCSRNWKE